MTSETVTNVPPNSTRSIRVLLVDDHRLFRECIRSLLQKIEDFEVVGEASDGREALDSIRDLSPDVVLMDLLMPELNGLDATARASRQFPGTKLIVLSTCATQDLVLQALRAGAAGYLVKSSDPAELEMSVRAVARGETFLSTAISGHMLDVCLGRVERERSSLERLSSRQREVLQLIAEGHTTKEIARKMKVTPKTAESYRTELMKALDIHDIASLTRYAIRSGLVSPDV